MMDAFLFVGLPYLSLLLFVVGCIWRARREKFTLSARSSQFLEDRQLLFGSTPWHIGIGVVLLGHIMAGFLPKVWSSLLTVPGALLVVESVGVACSLLAIVGLSVLLVRRLTSGKVQAVTTPADLVVVGLLLAQVVVGLLSAVHYRYGAAWSTGTVVPYFWSLVKLEPDMTYVSGFPPLFKLHLTLAWVIILLVPFTRLIHLLALPLQYLWRSPILVLWNNARRRREAVVAVARAETRREFLKGAAGVAGAGGLLALGVMEKGVNYFRGPQPDPEVEAALLSKKLQRLQQTAEERELELERQRNEMILVARYSELTENKGKYFIDYAMAPALAFKDKDGLPLLISAKCTHLGCTVGSEVDSQGRILCPCHVSYFDLRTGRPNEGAPAKAPLRHIHWALVDSTGKVVARKAPGKPLEGTVDPATLAQCSVYIVKPRSNAA